MEKNKQFITLNDGRKLGFAEYGIESGIPVFYFHGAASSRLEQLFNETELVKKDVRLICIDRPGHGISDFQPNRTLLDWPDDIDQLANHLSVSKLKVMGYSHGGPHALVCCYRMPEKIITGTIVSSWAPPNRSGAYRGMPIGNRLLNGSARWFPWLTKILRRMIRRMVTGDVQKVAQLLMSSVPESDKEILVSGKAIDNMTISVREGFRTGWEGVVSDDIAVNQNWEFDITEIKVPITIWHGELDVNVPYHAAIYLHDRLANSNLISMEDEGHFIMVKHASKILSSVVSNEPANIT